MGLTFRPAGHHWNYYIALDRDFEQVARFVEPSTENENTYSIELSRILMMATQEVDVLMKMLCKLLDPAAKRRNIKHYEAVIESHIPDFKEESVRIPRFGLTSQPWLNWSDEQSPFWWLANNDIKHERNLHFNQATLKNAHNSLAALLLTNAYLVKHSLPETNDPALANDWWRVTTRFNPAPNLHRLDESYYIAAGAIGQGKYAADAM